VRAVKIIVKGLVQGIGFRYYCYRAATELSINGYAKNLFNGDVEVFAQGEKGLINDFIKKINTGSPYSKVTSVHVEEKKYDDNIKSFKVY